MEGTYNCTAKNKENTISSSAALRVYGKFNKRKQNVLNQNEDEYEDEDVRDECGDKDKDKDKSGEKGGKEELKGCAFRLLPDYT